MRARRCTRAIIAAILASILLTLFLDDPVFFLTSLVLSVLLVTRYYTFQRNASLLASSVRITRTLQKPVVRQGFPVNLTTRITLTIPDSLTARYRDEIPSGFTLDDGETDTEILSSGTHTIQLMYRVIPLLHGNCEITRGTLTLADRLFEMKLTLSKRSFQGPTLKVQPHPIFQKKHKRNEFGGREVEQIRPISGYSVRMYREYVAGDDLRNIDWKLSAKQESLIVREYTGVESFVPLIVVDLPDRELPFDTDGFKKMIGAVSARVEQSLDQKEGISLLIISGPNVIEMIHEERNRTRYMKIIREDLHPQFRLHHLYRMLRRSDIRERIQKLKVQQTDDDRKENTDYRDRLIQIYQNHLLATHITHFSAQIARALSSVRVREIYLYSLCEGDMSHIQEIATQARRLRLYLRIKTPLIHQKPQITEVFRTLKGDVIEGLS